jgi:uncharacterized protein YqfA (UPF0365 family)
MAGQVWIIVGVVAVLFALVMLVVVGQFINLYIQALLSNAHVNLLDLVGMRLRKVDIRTIVLSRIRAVKAGLDIPTNALEQHYLAGGRVPNVVSAIIAARAAKIDLPWDTARAIDLAGTRHPFRGTDQREPQSDRLPRSGWPRSTIDAVAQDGIQLRAKAKVTVRTNIGRLVGGATEETIIARVGEGIVTTIGSAHSHKDVLANPDSISKTVMAKGLDAGTALRDPLDRHRRCGCGREHRRQAPGGQANADKQRAQAEAEKRARWPAPRSRSTRRKSRRTRRW